MSSGLATSRWLKAGRKILDGHFEQAATTFDEIGSVPDEAEARLRAGQALLAEGRRAKAGEQFERALAFYREVGATRYASQCEQAFADTAWTKRGRLGRTRAQAPSRRVGSSPKRCTAPP